MLFKVSVIVTVNDQWNVSFSARLPANRSRSANRSAHLLSNQSLILIKLEKKMQNFDRNEVLTNFNINNFNILIKPLAFYSSFNVIEK